MPKVNICTSSDIMDILFYVRAPWLMHVKTQLQFRIQLLFLGCYNDPGVGQGLGKPLLEVLKKAEADPMIEKQTHCFERQSACMCVRDKGFHFGEKLFKDLSKKKTSSEESDSTEIRFLTNRTTIKHK